MRLCNQCAYNIIAYKERKIYKKKQMKYDKEIMDSECEMWNLKQQVLEQTQKLTQMKLKVPYPYLILI